MELIVILLFLTLLWIVVRVVKVILSGKTKRENDWNQKLEQFEYEQAKAQELDRRVRYQRNLLARESNSGHEIEFLKQNGEWLLDEEGNLVEDYHSRLSLLRVINMKKAGVKVPRVIRIQNKSQEE